MPPPTSSLRPTANSSPAPGTGNPPEERTGENAPSPPAQRGQFVPPAILVFQPQCLQAAHPLRRQPGLVAPEAHELGPRRGVGVVLFVEPVGVDQARPVGVGVV